MVVKKVYFSFLLVSPISAMDLVNYFGSQLQESNGVLQIYTNGAWQNLTTPPAPTLEPPIITVPNVINLASRPVIRATPLFKGFGEANTTVILALTTPSGAILYSPSLNVLSNGTWRGSPFTLTESGVYSVSAVETAGGAQSAPSAPVAFSFILTPPGQLPAPTITSPTVNSILSTNFIVVSGAALPGSIVTVYVDGSSMGAIQADSTTGVWTVLVGRLSSGNHTLTATAVESGFYQSALSVATPVTIG